MGLEGLLQHGYSRILIWGRDQNGAETTRLVYRRPGFDLRKEKELIFSLKRPDQLWTPLSLLFNGYEGLFPRD